MVVTIAKCQISILLWPSMGFWGFDKWTLNSFSVFVFYCIFNSGNMKEQTIQFLLNRREHCMRINAQFHRSHNALRDVNRKCCCGFMCSSWLKNHKSFIVPAENHVGLKHSVLVRLVKSSTWHWALKSVFMCCLNMVINFWSTGAAGINITDTMCQTHSVCFRREISSRESNQNCLSSVLWIMNRAVLSLPKLIVCYIWP